MITDTQIKIFYDLGHHDEAESPTLRRMFYSWMEHLAYIDGRIDAQTKSKTKIWGYKLAEIKKNILSYKEQKTYWTDEKEALSVLEMMFETDRTYFLHERNYFIFKISDIISTLENYPKYILDTEETYYTEEHFSSMEKICNTDDILEKLNIDFNTSMELKSPKTTNWSKTSHNIDLIRNLFLKYVSPNNIHDINMYLKS